MNRLRALWWRISGGLWFVPSLMVLMAVALAFGLVEAEGLFGSNLARDWPRLFGAGAEGAREMLSAIAGSMITVAGVVFSVTLVALSLAASQYSPRVLRTFMHDRPTQMVLGAFVSVFAYCLVVLRTIRGGDEGAFMPSVAVLGGIVLAFVAIGVLVFFIHHLATAIQVSTILSRVAAATLQTIEEMFPEQQETSPARRKRAPVAPDAKDEWTPVPSATSGYVVSVDFEGLGDFARNRNRVVRMDCGIGDFVMKGERLVSLGGRQPVDDEICRELNALYSTDLERTLEQDAAFGVQQIVDIALRALSPGINDQSTALNCIDRLAEILVQLSRRRIEAPPLMDSDRVLVWTAGPTFAGLAGLCLDSIRASAGGKRPVFIRLIWALERAARAGKVDRLPVLSAQLNALIETAERTVPEPRDRLEIVTAARRVESLLAP